MMLLRCSKSLVALILGSLAGLVWITSAVAHPVIYQGGTVMSTSSSHRKNEVLLSYSFRPWVSLGYHGLFTSAIRQNLAKSSFRLARWNGEDYQGNIYASLGAGLRDGLVPGVEKDQDVAMAEVQADWEDRRIYTMARHSVFQVDRDQESESMFRLGFAPFLADFQELNVWFIAEVEDSNVGTLPNEVRTQSLNQYLRFFFRNVLWEIGSGFDRSYKLNIMIHM